MSRFSGRQDFWVTEKWEERFFFSGIPDLIQLLHSPSPSTSLPLPSMRKSSCWPRACVGKQIFVKTPFMKQHSIVSPCFLWLIGSEFSQCSETLLHGGCVTGSSSPLGWRSADEMGLGACSYPELHFTDNQLDLIGDTANLLSWWLQLCDFFPYKGSYPF